MIRRCEWLIRNGFKKFDFYPCGRKPTHKIIDSKRLNPVMYVCNDHAHKYKREGYSGKLIELKHV